MDSELRAAAEAIVEGFTPHEWSPSWPGGGVSCAQKLARHYLAAPTAPTPEQIEAAAKAGYAFSVAQGDYYEQDVPPFEEATPDRQRRMKATAGAVIAAYLATLPADDDAGKAERDWVDEAFCIDFGMRPCFRTDKGTVRLTSLAQDVPDDTTDLKWVEVLIREGSVRAEFYGGDLDFAKLVNPYRSQFRAVAAALGIAEGRK